MSQGREHLGDGGLLVFDDEWRDRQHGCRSPVEHLVGHAAECEPSHATPVMRRHHDQVGFGGVGRAECFVGGLTEAHLPDDADTLGAEITSDLVQIAPCAGETFTLEFTDLSLVLLHQFRRGSDVRRQPEWFADVDQAERRSAPASDVRRERQRRFTVR